MLGWRSVLALVVLVGVVVTAVASASPRASAAPNPYVARVGFSSHTTFMNNADAASYLARAHGIGVRWVREDFVWSMLEPRKGHFDWRVTDRLMRSAALKGMSVLAVFGYAPGWANGGRDDKFPPLNPRDYATAAVAVVRRYGRNGRFWRTHPRLPQRPLKAIELWNEPWVWPFWKPEPDVDAYARLLRATAPRIKATQTRVAVLASIDLQIGYTDARDISNGTGRRWEHGFLAQLLTRDYAFRAIDGYAIHPYSDHGPYASTIPGYGDQEEAQQWLYQRLLLVRDMLQAANRFRPLWSTELGWSTARGVDEHTQGAYVRDALKRAVEEWRAFVARSFVYVLEKPNNGHPAGGYNLLRDDLSPKPGWFHLRDLLRG